MRRWWFLIHKWVGLVVGLQVLAWVASGLFMTWFPIERVRGEHNIRETPPHDLHQAVDLTTATDALAKLSIPISRLELVDIAGRWTWRIDSNGKPHALMDVTTGNVVSPLDEAAARTIASADFAGQGSIVAAALIEKDAPIEYRGVLPVWKLEFDDPDETHLYVSPLTGKVVARRSGLWRAYDFLWSLHIMDYSQREDFNHWPIVLIAFLSLVLTVTGMGVLVIRFWPRPSAR